MRPNSRRRASSGKSRPPLDAWFLGPKAEQAELWLKHLAFVVDDHAHWRRNHFPDDPSLTNASRREDYEEWHGELNAKIISLLGELKAHYPFYSLRYLGHMLSEQTLPAVVGYIAAMLYNPNNVTEEAAPVTVRLELEVGRMVSQMLGFNPRKAWAHLCSGGTIANLEALWVARSAQFAPLIAQDYCTQHRLAFEVEMPDGKTATLTDLSPRELLGLKSATATEILSQLAVYLYKHNGEPRKKIAAELTKAISTSRFNLAKKGFGRILREIGLDPVIYISAAAHYSVKKAANVLSYGEDAVKLIPVTHRFRVDANALRDAIWNLSSDQYVAAVIGIAGTTEEGAVDPLHEIHFLQQESCAHLNRSFWFHVDAAWGGYIRSLFEGHKLPRRKHRENLDVICTDYGRAILAKESCQIRVDGGNSKSLQIEWNDREVLRAFIALRSADSVTVDPHKLGYIPYPAGLVAFRRNAVTQFSTQRAQYISEEQYVVKGVDELPPQITAVGPYSLEGSKPGAVAAACWLAHTTIPLTHNGHGRIIKASLLSAKRLYAYLLHHRQSFRTIDSEIAGKDSLCKMPFTFIPLSEPDTNVLCYAAVPMIWHKRALTPVDMPLKLINKLNRHLYEELSLPAALPDGDATFRSARSTYNQSYYVSKTVLEEEQYSYKSIAKALKPFNASEPEYRAEGLLVLRSTVMNPLYNEAMKQGKDYLLDFVKHLHRITRSAVADICWSYDEAA
jgi:glutamate/tyrosine decarboxylase-like PLP-dependent enzyme